MELLLIILTVNVLGIGLGIGYSLCALNDNLITLGKMLEKEINKKGK
jgi:hypothetical protein